MKKLSVLVIVAVVIYLSHAWAKHLAYEQEEVTIELVQKLSILPNWGCFPDSDPNSFPPDLDPNSTTCGCPPDPGYTG